MIRIDKITMAVDKMDEMAAFYGGIFDIAFTPVELYGRQLNAAAFNRTELLLCPKDLAGVNANVNTIQLRFVIKDVASAVKKGLAGGGTLITGIQEIEGRAHAALRDPDGNSLELIQD